MNSSFKKVRHIGDLCPNLAVAQRTCLSLVLFFVLQLGSSNILAQSTTLSLDMKNVPLKEVLNAIELKTGYSFLYNKQIVDVNRKVTVLEKNQNLKTVLNNLFKQTDIIFTISAKQIVLSKKKDEKNAEQRSLNVIGKVTDDTGDAIPGVTIGIKGSKTTAVTDINGNYRISALSQQTLVFTYIGMQTAEVKIDQDVIDISLSEASNTLGEVVAVGYGKQKRASLVGAITTIAPKSLQMGATRSMSNNLAGQLGGVIAVQRSGEPGYDNSNFWIRGISTFTGANSPLVIIDGVDRSLNDIDPAEIESFSILKDASASAVYGVRGANGVVVINTKRGQVSKPRVDFRVERSFTQPVKLPQFVGAADYLDVMNSIAQESGMPQPYPQIQIDNIRNKVDPDLYPDVNWLDAITNDYASNSRSNLTVSGGTKMLRYSVVGSYYTEAGIIARDTRQDWDSSLKLHRYNVRSNVDLNVTPTTLFRVNIGGYLQEDTRPSASIDDLFNYSFETPPYEHPTQYSTGQIPRVVSRVNPWALATQTGYQRNSSSAIQSLFSVEQNLKFITPGLSATIKFSFDRYSQSGVVRRKDPDYGPPATGRNPDGTLNFIVTSYGQPFLGYSTTTNWGNKSVYLEGNLSYSRTFGKNDVDAMFMYNQKNYDNGSALPYLNQGIAGRFSYTYDRRYIGEFNFGYNGSENFAPGKRFGFFPSVAIGWYLSEEEFMKQLKETLSKVKIRGSYGSVGNDQIGGRRFAYITTIGDTGGYNYGVDNDYGRGGRWDGDFGVSNLTWETVSKSNIGLELGLFDMIELQVDVFKDQRRNIFMQRGTVPASAGFIQTPWANFGKVDNQGIDMSLNINKQFSKDLNVSARGSLTYAKNTIMEIDEARAIIGTTRAQTGHPVNQIYGLIADGLFTDDDFVDVTKGTLRPGIAVQQYSSIVRPGDIKYKDLNEDGFITDLDRTAIGGTNDPQIVYGFGSNIRYKNFDLGVFFQGNVKTYRIIQGAAFIPGSGAGALGNIYSNVNDRWTVENPSQNVFWPRLTNGVNENNSQSSTWWLRDMSMLRLKDVEFGYSFPSKLIRKAAMKAARIYVKGDNLLTFSAFNLWDPELGSNNGFRYPIMKSVSVGLNVSF